MPSLEVFNQLSGNISPVYMCRQCLYSLTYKEGLNL